ncbi:MAG: GatB/YqeY domain-containing protein [Patescibacteria group bacterium]
MSILEELDRDLLTATKTEDKFNRDTLRLVKSALHNEKIAQGQELSDPQTLSVITREIKKRKESAEAFRLAGRTEAAQTERLEAELLGKYLPPQLAEEELTAKVIKYLTDHPDQRQIGQVIGALTAEVQGRADIATLAKIVKEQLAPGQNLDEG